MILYKIINNFIIPYYFGYVNKKGKKIKNKRLHLILNLHKITRLHEMSGRSATKSTDYSRTIVFYIWYFKWLNCLVLRHNAGQNTNDSTIGEFRKAIYAFCKILAQAIHHYYPHIKEEDIYQAELLKWKIPDNFHNQRITYYRDLNDKSYFQVINTRGLDGKQKESKSGESKIKGIVPPCPNSYYGLIFIDEAQQIKDEEKFKQAIYSIRNPKDKFVCTIILLNSDDDNHFLAKKFKELNLFQEDKLLQGIPVEYQEIYEFDNKNLQKAINIYRVSNLYTYKELLEEEAPDALINAEISKKTDYFLQYKKDWIGIPYSSLENIYPNLDHKNKVYIDFINQEIKLINFGIDIGVNNSKFSIVIKICYFDKNDYNLKWYVPFILKIDNKNKIYFDNLNNNQKDNFYKKMYNQDILDIALNFINNFYEKYPRLYSFGKRPNFLIDDNTQGWIRLFKQALLKTQLIDSIGSNIKLIKKIPISKRINIHNQALKYKIFNYSPELFPLFEEMNNAKIDELGNRIKEKDDTLNAEEYSWILYINEIQRTIGKIRGDIK